MSIPEDKRLHLIFGAVAAAGAFVVLLLGHAFGIGPALAFASTAVGVGYEIVQRVRKSGTPSLADAAFTAAPGWLAWAGLWLSTL